MKKLALITLHGMGATLPDYSNKLTNILSKRMSSSEFNALHISSVYYQAILQENEERVYEKSLDVIPKPAILRGQIEQLRQFLLYGFSDAAGYLFEPGAENSTLYQVQKTILDKLSEAFQKVGPTGSVVIVAQSLGGFLMSDFIWDAQRKNKEGKLRSAYGVWKDGSLPDAPEGSDMDNFRRLKNLKLFITTGCNIPVVVSGHKDPQPFAAPNAEFRWRNLYDRDDVLGWPLGPLSPAYEAMVLDQEMNSGNLLTSWTPFSHSAYWEDRDFIDLLLGELRALL